MSEPSPPPRAPRRRGCVLILLGLTVVFAVYGWMFFSDLDDLDDADLRLDYPAVAAEKNAYTWLERARDSRSLDLSIGNGVTRAKRTSENQDAFDCILEAAACEVYVPPPIEGIVNDTEPQENRDLLRLFGYDALEREDLDQLWAVIAAEKRLALLRSEWPLSTAGHFWMTSDRQMEFLTRRAIELQTSPEVLRRWLKDYTPPLLVPDWQQRSLRRQYELSVQWLTNPEMRRELNWGGLRHPILLRPKRTIAAYGEILRGWIEKIDTGEPADAYEPPSFFEKVGWVLGGNFTGESMLDLSLRMAPYDFFGREGAPELANDAIFKTALALRIYQLENGTYPTDLQELVPDLLDAVPIDPHELSGKPLRWDAARRTLWSVGEDAVDDGAPEDPDLKFGTAEAGGVPDRTLILPEVK